MKLMNVTKEGDSFFHSNDIIASLNCLRGGEWSGS